MGVHDDIETTAAEYFTTHAEIALSEVRDPVTGFDAQRLEALRDAASAFLASLPVAAPVTHSPIGWLVPGVWPSCSCGFAPRDNGALTSHWNGYGVQWFEDHGALRSHPSDVSPLPTVVQWATS